MLLNAKLLNVLRCLSMKIMKMKIRKNEDHIIYEDLYIKVVNLF